MPWQLLFTGSAWASIGNLFNTILGFLLSILSGGTATLALVLCLALSGCASGSKDMTEEQWERQKERAAQTAQLAKDTGAILVLQLGHDGRVGGYANTEFGLNTGANFNATLLMVPGLTGMVDRLQAAMAPLPKNP